MTDKTFHVVPSKEGWAVKKAGKKAATFSSQDKAVKAARKSAKREREAQVVVHAPNGSFVLKEVRGLPVVQKPPQRSSIGTTRISKAISDILKERLEKA
jgi:hypothetical protein